MNLFIGGPRHKARNIHEKMVSLACSGRTTRGNFEDVRAFDDSQAKAASRGSLSWRNYLRTCDAAVFLLPADWSGSKDKRFKKFYTQMEIEQASTAGIRTYLIIERASGRRKLKGMSLINAAKSIYANDLGEFPIALKKGSRAAPEAQLLTACQEVLEDAIQHWKQFATQVDSHTITILETIQKTHKTPDAALGDLKTARCLHHRSCPADSIERYITACYHLRRNAWREPELSRHLLRAYLFITRPCLQTADIEDSLAASEEEVWERLAALVDSSRHVGPTLSEIPTPNRQLVDSLSDWRRRALVRLLREAAIAFRYRLDLATDWAFTKLLFAFYSSYVSAGENKGNLRLDLAVAVVPSAALAQKVDELNALDKGGTLIGTLNREADVNGNEGALQTLAGYHATCGQSQTAVECIRKAIAGFETKKAKGQNLMHCYILLTCFCVDGARTAALEKLNASHPNWEQEAHPIYAAIGAAAKKDPSRSWREILSSVPRSAP